MRINDNFEKLPESYLFSEVARRLNEYKAAHPEADVVRMDIGDVTLPIAGCVVSAMHRAVEDMADATTFHGYGPEQGYSFLRDAIAAADYQSRGIGIDADEIFISDGAKSDLGNLGDIYSSDSIVAVADPGYPVYVDSAVMSGRGGDRLPDGRWSRIVYLECNAENGFRPAVPDVHADIVILCSPSNPTGAVMTREDLREWVDYALREKSLIIFDSAYEAFVRNPSLPRSIYEIEGAEKVAIEIRSFSKTAGFTGLRCGYTVVPKALTGTDASGREVSLGKLWNRRQCTKFNGAGYVVQRGAEALYSSEGRESVRNNIDYYLENAGIIRRSLSQAGYAVFGGEDSPYVWIKGKNGESSWQLFGDMLEKYNISCTPGVGFGVSGDGYIRLTGFNSRENTLKAMKRICDGREK
ncbi:MAG: LL-diaminopimelate aminotransferase [Muribaculaceae bacterium]|jgi:LL-diaminopimelate aminotransferase|uniref:LL-diaminopimelate aminotransferase n=1 Tax=Bacteroidales TaxID=171549 RepID=UPI000F49743B|nr:MULTISPECIES: LL-diaminopimelate aminotransferase [Bacteroidales]MBJ2192455.1 LL-diaminopimelate aminotransferase [Muribaculaceae bacterium]ROS80400.1 LL-diaminopimelate aminotransferase [Muribaculaceae bacterium Isolate-036 (Harlan)]ROT22357.1 LL-diaminopimelate aminotransferase [Muribaculaceae bacterium Isolate-114 (HZI)]ROT24334.1 LL-diaminopimelate aminotransferase [Muribaculaceae bacterium Isolate-113 (HZI)]RXE67823.1 LL-diaminopimelate aminotransferase [Muribaculaceae bacterium Isolat